MTAVLTTMQSIWPISSRRPRLALSATAHMPWLRVTLLSRVHWSTSSNANGRRPSPRNTGCLTNRRPSGRLTTPTDGEPMDRCPAPGDQPGASKSGVAPSRPTVVAARIGRSRRLKRRVTRPVSAPRADHLRMWLPAGAGDEGGHDVGGMPIEAVAGPVVAHGGARGRRGRRRPGRRAVGTAASKAAVMKLCRRLCGEIRLVIPAARASRFTIRVRRTGRAADRRRRKGSGRAGVRRWRGRWPSRARSEWMVTRLPPLRTIRSVGCPHSTLRCSMSALRLRRSAARSMPAATPGA